jgi:hypothetical protein
MSDRASKALAEAALPGEPQTYDTKSKRSGGRRLSPPRWCLLGTSRDQLFFGWNTRRQPLARYRGRAASEKEGTQPRELKRVTIIELNRK